MTGLRIGVVPGDGIGKEVVPVAARALEEAARTVGQHVELVWTQAGYEHFEQTGTALDPKTLEVLESCVGVLFGAVGSPSHSVVGYRSPILQLRRHFDLYANLRPLETIQGLSSQASSDVDLLIVRENTEGLYAGRERIDSAGTGAVAEHVVTASATERIVSVAARRALDRAAERSRTPRVTVVHKANVLRVADALFREVALDTLAEYPEIEVTEQLVDSMAYRLLVEPEDFEVIVTSNLYGDILSDAGAALVGGLGVVASANVGDDFVLAEPVHGSAPDIAGCGIANPAGTLMAAVLLLSELGHREAAGRLKAATTAAIQACPTRDLGGEARTLDVGHAVVEHLHSPL